MSAAESPHALPATARVAVIGSGTMGAGIAQVAAVAGHPVQLYDSRDGAAAKAIADIRASLDKLANKGKITHEQAQGASDRLSVAHALQEMRDARLVVEAIVEQLAAKQELFGKLEAIVDAQCILASNTSSISITQIAATLRHPERLAGMHFFNPVPMMALVELIRGYLTSDATHDTVKELAERLGKSPITVKNAPGFVVNRILVPMINEAFFVLSEGIATAEDIDAGMKLGCNQPIGPLALADMIGLDVCLAVMEVYLDQFGDSKYRPCPLLKEMVAAGQLGRKTGRGVYTY